MPPTQETTRPPAGAYSHSSSRSTCMRKFTGRGDDEGQGLGRALEALRFSQQRIGQCEAEGYGLARTRLRGDEQVSPNRVLIENGSLDRRGLEIGALLERTGKGGVGFWEGHCRVSSSRSAGTCALCGRRPRHLFQHVLQVR